MEGELTVQHHQHHAYHGEHCAEIHLLAQLLTAAGEQGCQHHRQQGAHAHKDADIGGVCMVESGILQEEVKAAACNTDEKEEKFILPVELQKFRPQRP